TYEPPERRFGFDVALLTQVRPDVLGERFTTEPVATPNEFFREVPRDDNWVQALLCARTVETTPQNAVSSSERPTNCPN
ncbi:MAG: hypothetical protein SFW36_23290, partial [Leptolyngbyaceae cyanobacterium bins.59]|nr:hypothetical protein [Leptolyngbyaceae cyanobacterium bins.59]